MSYCRFSSGDVYIYHHVDGYLECCACRLMAKIAGPMPDYIKEMHKKLGWKSPKSYAYWDCFTTRSRTKMLEHITHHKQLGHKVGRGAISRLKQEIKELGDTV